ncbi:MAG: ABC transporter permease [Gemmatimonadetes bacterium]|nr:ABC transporter permease [Gemmatimonadota bacterium]
MAVPILYNVRSLRQRPVSTLATALGMALVVAVFIAVMALASGFSAALARTGSRDNAIVLRQGADSELASGLDRDAAQIISAMPFVARGADGRPLVSPEVYVIINLDRPGGGTANVVARGVSAQAFEVRKGVRVVEGRTFRSGAPEILIGRSIASRFGSTAVGDKLRFANRDWTVVGHFEAGGSSFESEIWGENEQFMPAFRGEVFQSVTFRMQDPAALKGLEQTLEKDPRLRVDVEREYDFYANQSTLLTQILEFFAVFVTSIMAVGAVAGAVNTMYAAVANRAPEIAVLRTLGFRPAAIVGSFLLESVAIALAGGIIGCLLALPINGITTSTTNWSSFSEVAFPFRVTPDLLAAGLAFALLMGLVGGFFPALRAARMPIVQALRQA